VAKAKQRKEASERKVWVLDTETKGTGAEMVPLEKMRERNKTAPKESRVSVIRRRPGAGAEEPAESSAPSPRRPPRFKLVNALDGRVVAEGVGAREIADLLAGMRSLVDARVYVWERETDEWRALSLREQKRLWSFRGPRARRPTDRVR
jgi:hypothetical protein